MAASVNFPGTPIDYGVKLQTADGTTAKDFIVGPVGGVMIGTVRVCSDDTAAVTLQFIRTVSGVDYVMGEVAIPAGAGTNGSASWVDVLASLNLDNALTLPAGSKLRVKAKTAVTAAKTVDITADGGQF